jgi:hypothetical protein
MAGASAGDPTTTSNPASSGERQLESERFSGESASFTPVTVSLLGGDTSAVLGTDGEQHVVYELVLTNTRSIPATLNSVTVLNGADGSTIRSLEGAELLDSLRTLEVGNVDNPALPPNESRLLFVELSFTAAGAVPKALLHRIAVAAADSAGAIEPTPLSYAAGKLDLSTFSPPVFSPPLRGDGWLVINGCCDTSGVHRGAVFGINGKLFDAERFAIDWVRIDADGRLVVGDPFQVTNWIDYGAEVVAAADGVVVATLDKLEDQMPGDLPDPKSFTVATQGGNFVVLDHGNGFFTFYGHLQPKSVVVNVGDTIKRGQALARLGNTGNTSAPHLHFHVMNSASPLGSDGLPFVFDEFEFAGSTDKATFDSALDGTASVSPQGALRPVERKSELPLNFSIVDFPGH